ncbi:Plastocyanin [Richelia intracellularis HH01]|jgi:plastocyanin|uniref:Plastocyanin n=1 Tax=Richelia intracellularis HH01 TaxID=1165094 RepID=M1X0Q1_9NOST|nr:plastocyanin [Richelia intracellularis]CCH67623.1 Plastocyanin [Richelia intracellularis HH01]HAE05874.1 plastocyanin [Richelia sp.]
MKMIVKALRHMSLAAVLTVVFVMSSFPVFVSAAAAETYTIKMGTDKGMLAFEPSKLTIKAGDTVEFLNNKVPPHNIVFDSGKSADKTIADRSSHKQLLMSPGQSFQVSFEGATSGEYPFYCEPHRGAGMAGKIIVE